MIPPINNQTDLLVGEPVKNLDTSELNDSKAVTPMTINTTPTTNNATDIPLFINIFPLKLIEFKLVSYHRLAELKS